MHEFEPRQPFIKQQTFVASVSNLDVAHDIFCIQTAAATATVGNSMATASAAMASVGQAANPAKMQQTMQQASLLLLLF